MQAQITKMNLVTTQLKRKNANSEDSWPKQEAVVQTDNMNPCYFFFHLSKGCVKRLLTGMGH